MKPASPAVAPARRRTGCRFLLALLLLCCGLGSECCQPARSSGSRAEATEKVEGSAAARGSGATRPKEQRCRADRECPGFLRCFNARCEVPPAVHGDGPAQGPRVVFEVDGEREVSFRTELALSAFQSARGLMFRPSMDPGWGMLFLYPREKRHSFWMRNTYISLDMIFLGARGDVVCVQEHAEPLSLEGRSCKEPSQHVVELLGGAAARAGIRRGTHYRLVDLPGDPDTPQHWQASGSW